MKGLKEREAVYVLSRWKWGSQSLGRLVCALTSVYVSTSTTLAFSFDGSCVPYLEFVNVAKMMWLWHTIEHITMYSHTQRVHTHTSDLLMASSMTVIKLNSLYALSRLD